MNSLCQSDSSSDEDNFEEEINLNTHYINDDPDIEDEDIGSDTDNDDDDEIIILTVNKSELSINTNSKAPMINSNITKIASEDILIQRMRDDDSGDYMPRLIPLVIVSSKKKKIERSPSSIARNRILNGGKIHKINRKSSLEKVPKSTSPIIKKKSRRKLGRRFSRRESVINPDPLLDQNT